MPEDSSLHDNLCVCFGRGTKGHNNVFPLPIGVVLFYMNEGLEFHAANLSGN